MECDRAYGPGAYGAHGAGQIAVSLANLESLRITGCKRLGIDCVASLTALRVVMLQNNSLSGTIPADLPFAQYTAAYNGTSYSACGLGGNRFACPVPPAAQNHCLASRFDYVLSHMIPTEYVEAAALVEARDVVRSVADAISFLE